MEPVRRPLTTTAEGWPLAKRGDEIVWRGIRWRVESIDGDEMLVKAIGLTKRSLKRVTERIANVNNR